MNDDERDYAEEKFNGELLREFEGITDEQAMDNIRLIMSGAEWNADTLDLIAEQVDLTGRELRPPEERSNDDA